MGVSPHLCLLGLTPKSTNCPNSGSLKMSPVCHTDDPLSGGWPRLMCPLWWSRHMGSSRWVVGGPLGNGFSNCVAPLAHTAVPAGRSETRQVLARTSQQLCSLHAPLPQAV